MVYLLEYDAGIRHLVQHALKRAGLAVVGFGMAEEFWRAMSERTPDAVLLGTAPPDADRPSMLKKLRRGHGYAAPPVIMLSVMMLAALVDGGEQSYALYAEGFAPRPLDPNELAACVRDLITVKTAGEGERITQPQPDRYKAGRLTLDARARRVWADGEAVRLTDKEFMILAYMMKNKGAALTRGQIMNAVWGYDYDGATRTMDVHIRSLRRKLKACGGIIATVKNVGYRVDG
ncbi:MAG: response regulator transcription factor [Oscillospiraceae bacterium]|nr:response regulator transcription factor [Oscillospiraceae bacterium]